MDWSKTLCLTGEALNPLHRFSFRELSAHSFFGKFCEDLRDRGGCFSRQRVGAVQFQ